MNDPGRDQRDVSLLLLLVVGYVVTAVVAYPRLRQPSALVAALLSLLFWAALTRAALVLAGRGCLTVAFITVLSTLAPQFLAGVTGHGELAMGTVGAMVGLVLGTRARRVRDTGMPGEDRGTETPL